MTDRRASRGHDKGLEDSGSTRAVRRRALARLSRKLTRQDAVVLMVALGLGVVGIAVGEQLGGLWSWVPFCAATAIGVGLVLRHFERRLRDEVSLVLREDEKAGAEAGEVRHR
jgi:hypothetical protein